MPRTGIRQAADRTGLALCLFGEVAGDLLPDDWTIFWFSPVFVAGVATLLIRHVVWPRPALPVLLWQRARRVLAEPGVAPAWRITLLTRVGVLVVGLIAVTTLPWSRAEDTPTMPIGEVYQLPARWDAWWYLSIARYGYVWDETRTDRQQNVAFFPAYPAAMRLGASFVTLVAKGLRDTKFIGGSDSRFLWGGVLVSILCFGLALHRVHALALRDAEDSSAAARTLVLLACYPFALFFSAPYSESLALLAMAGAILAWREGSWGRTAAWGLLAGLARSNGWTLAVALVSDWLLGRRREGRTAALGAAMAPLAGTALFTGFVYSRTGDPFAWASAQKAWVGDITPFEFFTRRLDLVERLGWRGFVAADPIDALTAVVILWMIGVCGYLLVRRNWLYAALVGSYLAPALAIDLPATGRMTSVLFPAFIVLAMVTRWRGTVVLAAIFAVGQIWLAIRFFQWQTPY